MTTRREGISFDEKIACLTLDVEEDYDDFVGAFNIYRHHRDELEALAALFRAHDAPLSAFIRTDLLARYEGLGEFLTRLGRTGIAIRTATGSTAPIRARRSKLRTRVATISAGRRWGIARRWASSNRATSNASRRRGSASRQRVPSYARRVQQSVVAAHAVFLRERPAGNSLRRVPARAYTISLSYLKLVGLTAFKALVRACGLPNPLVFDSHFHDYIVCRESLGARAASLPAAVGTQPGKGTDYFRHFLDLLRAEGYG
jgi:hypothetical protein